MDVPQASKSLFIFLNHRKEEQEPAEETQVMPIASRRARPISARPPPPKARKAELAKEEPIAYDWISKHLLSRPLHTIIQEGAHAEDDDEGFLVANPYEPLSEVFYV